jgi:hypothetical protein
MRKVPSAKSRDRACGISLGKMRRVRGMARQKLKD